MVCLLRPLGPRHGPSPTGDGEPMLERLRRLKNDESEHEDADEAPASAPVFGALRLFSAELMVSSGMNATLQYLRDRRSWRGAGSVVQRDVVGVAAAWIPALLGAAASTAQARLALDPQSGAKTAVTLLNGAVVGIGIAAAADTALAAARGQRRFNLAPLLFGYSGVLGFLLDRQETLVAEQEAALDRRARIVERWVPRRRTKLDKIIVHV
jgi:hypothetical protein